MNRILFLVLVLGIVGYVADSADAHGGSFRGPNGGVPPGLREPSDPEPPPPPPSDPGDPGGPTTPSGPAPGGPETPPDQGHETPGGDPAPNPVGPTQGPTKKATTKSLTFESWRFWWGYNSDDILNLKTHIYSARTSSSSPIFFASKKDEENRRNATRPTERAVMKTIIPALLATINRPSDHEDVQGGAIVALGKIGTSKYLPLFEDVIWNRYKNEKDQAVKFGYQATESGVLALGLLPNIDDATRDQIRRICLAAIDDDKLRTRERAWAAVCLGLQRDAGAVRPLVERLGKSYSDDNIPAGLLCGLGLIGNCEETQAIREDLEKGLVKGSLFGRDIQSSDRIKSFVGYALMKIGDPKALPTLLSVLDSRKQGRIAKRSAAIAVGPLAAAEPDQKVKDTAVQGLIKYINNSGGDASGENFAAIALSQIGTEKALAQLLDYADNGQYGMRPFAALGLGTRIFYNDRDAEEGTAEPMDKGLRKKIVERIAKLSDRYKDADTKAAFMLARGLMRDASATEELVNLASSNGDPTLRGFCCVALGLMGDASDNVKDALKIALGERKSADLRRDAATGLGLLRDADVVKLLLDMLKQAQSFAVQGQLITAIGTIGDHTAIAPLVQILDDRTQNTATRAMAAVGLGMIGDLRELPPLARLSQNYNYRASVPDLDELLFIL